ncbi:MAG: aldehyde dehydrogenase family protein [Rhodobacteraceae bacterium]|nr:aldehyde dehydrogenase family protein [Paracoccaceae bacterium]
MVATGKWSVAEDLNLKMVIGGQRLEASNGARLTTEDPATGRVIGSFPAATADDVGRAVENSRAALKGDWRRMTPAARGRVLVRAAAILRREADRLARIETLDSGKPLREAKADLETSAGYFEYYGGFADKLEGTSIPLGPDYMSFTLHEPVGVTAHVIPWNFPLTTTARGVAPALAAGCTAVVKPAALTTLTSLLLADVLDEAGLPAGVYNVVPGRGSEAGAALVAHPDVAHVTFTGSVATGQGIMRTAADHVASVTLELGGKSPVAVLADADLGAAVEGTLKAIYMNAGQVCSAGSRLVVERKVHAAMMERLVPRVAAMEAGHGLDDAAIGPMVSAEQVQIVADYVEDARRANSLEILVGGRRLAPAGLERGHFYAPTIIDDAPRSARVVQEEIFGPVLTVQIVDSPEEAIAVANDSPFGLCAGIYTRDIARAMAFARDVDAGQVFINQYFAGGISTPFGGTKMSGFGREKGLAALASYYRVKCITTRL